MHLLPHLYAVPVGISVPHVPQDGIHGTAVVELLFKLVWVTWAQVKEPFKWTVPPGATQGTQLFHSVLTRKLDIHKDFDECLSQVGSMLVRAEHSLAMKHTRDEWVLSLIQVRHHSLQHFSQLGSQVRIFHPARESKANPGWDGHGAEWNCSAITP